MADVVESALTSARSFLDDLITAVSEADYAYEEKEDNDAFLRLGKKLADWQYDGTFASHRDDLDAALRARLSQAGAGGANPATMTERLIDAAIYNEQASGCYVTGGRKELSEARAAIEAALAASLSAGERDGWRLVPIEPDARMHAAGSSVLAAGQGRVWQAMLDHAPTPPATPVQPTASVEAVAGWRPINSALDDEWLLVATTGGWVGEAMVLHGEWKWASGHVFHSDIVPLKWMPLPEHPEVAADPAACLTPAEQKQQADRCSCHGSDDYCPCQNTPDATTIRNRKGA